MLSTRKIGLFAAVLSFPAHAGSLHPQADVPEVKLRTAIEAFMQEQKVPGLQVAVLDASGARWSAGFGVSDLENAVKVTPVTRFRIASISKALSAVAVMRLVERGQLDLDERVQKYCPAYPEKPWPITSRQLLAHTAGVRHYKDDAEYNNTKHFATILAGLELFKADALEAEPGTQFLYTTFGYTLLGCVAEAAASKDFATLMQDEVFGPAHLDQTGLDDVNRLIPGRAYGYYLDASGRLVNSDLADTSYKIPGGGLVSTADDLVSFAAATMKGSMLQPETLRAMWQEQTTREGTGTEYGLGWILEATADGRREVYHTGSQHRVSTVVYLLPEEGRVVSIMSNLEDSRPLALARKPTDILAGRETPPVKMKDLPRRWYDRVKN